MEAIKGEVFSSHYIVMPQHSNPSGLMFGGVLMQWVDMAAAIAAERFSGKNVATVYLSEMSFSHPIRVGDHVSIETQVVAKGRTSMKIESKVYVQDPKNGKDLAKTLSTQATFIFVALGPDSKPVSF